MNDVKEKVWTKTKSTRTTKVHFKSNKKTDKMGESEQESEKKKNKQLILIYTQEVESRNCKEKRSNNFKDYIVM